ncbi:hypothetical protein GCM10025867_20860 [Frondihabitans sucicola]|uniref:Uncharacterized protein n=1 Tax=Frondihabitans sucicola TaxID=1268041 RepID=A0ABN6Y1T2_9MICO|nr:hypothetical protein GCM10025867_20860 [Frondihabitans sucicola]
MASGRRLREDLLDVGEEPEVEHLVGFVEDDFGDALEVEEPLTGEVEEPPGVPTTIWAPAFNCSTWPS